MPELNIGAAATAGFGILQRHFGAVAIWGLVALLLALVPFLFALPQFMDLARLAQGGPESASGVGALGANPFTGLVNLPFSLASFVLIQAAIFRAILAPQQGGLAFIRIGTAELMMAVFFVGYFIAAVLVVVIFAGVFGVIVYAVGRTNAAAAWLIGIPYWIAVAVGFIWLWCRLSLVAPSIVANGELRFSEAWALTKGRVVSLFLTWLLNFVILAAVLIVVYIVLLIVIGVVVGGAAVALGAGGANPADLANRLQHMGPALIALVVLCGALLLGVYIMIIAVFQTMAYAPWADVYRQLTRSDTAQTFA